MGRILINLLKRFAHSDQKFILYFKGKIPGDEFLDSPNFVLRKLEPLLDIESNAIFEHILLPWALKQDGADIFYAPSYTAPIYCPVPFVLVIHDISYEVHPEWVPGFDQIFRRLMGRWSAKRAKKIIAISEFTRSEILKQYKTSEHKVIQIYQTATDDSLLRESDESLNLPDKPYTVFVGTFFNRRHIPELIAAVEKVNRTQPFSLALVGEDKTFPAQNIETLINDANQRLGRVAVYRYKNLSDASLALLYKNASSISLLSEYEGFGLPLLEGMALGTPVLIAPGSSLSEVAKDAALTCDPTDPNAIADSLLKLENDKTLRQKLIESGKIRAQDFSWDKAAELTLNVIQNKI